MQALPPALLLLDVQRLLFEGAISSDEWSKAELIATVRLQDAGSPCLLVVARMPV